MTFDSVLAWGQAIATVVGAASIAVWAIAPLTETKLDDRLGGWLSKLQGLLKTLGLNKS